MKVDQIVVSPCSVPKMELEAVLQACSDIGYRFFEVFTSWTASAFDCSRAPAFYRTLGEKYHMQFHSMHLPPINDDIDTSLAEAVSATKFAKALDVKVVLFKATSRPNYIKAGKRFLDAIESMGITSVLQNHKGTPITTLDDFREVLEGINDSRMKTLLEVGHFHSVGVSWRKGYELLQGRIALVHIKDQIGVQPVPYGKGEIDLKGLLHFLDNTGYQEKYVVEMEVADRENVFRYLADALEFLKNDCSSTIGGVR